MRAGPEENLSLAGYTYVMGKLAFLGSLLAAICFACRVTVPDSNQDMERYVGDYSSTGGSLVFLYLRSGGQYECFISQGDSDGCLSVVGSGMSTGEWMVVDEALSFNVVHEPDDLVMSMAGATGKFAGEVLLVTAGGSEFHFSDAGYP